MMAFLTALSTSRAAVGLRSTLVFSSKTTCDDGHVSEREANIWGSWRFVRRMDCASVVLLAPFFLASVAATITTKASTSRKAAFCLAPGRGHYKELPMSSMMRGVERASVLVWNPTNVSPPVLPQVRQLKMPPRNQDEHLLMHLGQQTRYPVFPHSIDRLVHLEN